MPVHKTTKQGLVAYIYIYINYKIGKQCVSLQSTVPCATRGVPTPPRVPCFSASPTSPACSVRMISEYLPSHNLVPVPFPVFLPFVRTDGRTNGFVGSEFSEGSRSTGFAEKKWSPKSSRGRVSTTFMFSGDLLFYHVLFNWGSLYITY